MTEPRAQILVTEKLSPSGLDRLRAAGHDVDVQVDLGRSPQGDVALQVLALDQPAPGDLTDAIGHADGITSVHAFSL